MARVAVSGCPLCGHVGHSPSWLGETRHLGRRYEYVRCTGCGSLHCDPMPDGDALAAMYGPAYQQGAGDEAASATDEGVALDLLDPAMPGTFVDYGCGAEATLLRRAIERGWTAIGVEYDAEVAAGAGAASGARVVTADEAADADLTADVLHLGDVVEHLTDAPRQLADVLRLVRPGGLVVAQGPLEAHADVFTWVLAAARRLRGRPPVAMPPYHVLLATAEGQRALFRRVGLEEVSFRVREVAWPAPARWADARGVRGNALWLLRRASAVASALSGRRLGNRYDYVGRRPD